MAGQEDRSPGADGRFITLLRAMHDISLELSSCRDAGDLCRRAVEWGLAHLGFDRLSLWFIDPSDPDWNVGTWGTDESGKLRDERGARVRRNPLIAPPEFYEGKLPALVARDHPCYDESRNIVGRADTVLAPLWDGKRIIGELSADNLLSRRAMQEEDVDLLVLYARIVAHLYSLHKAKEEAADASEARRTLLRELWQRTNNSQALIGSLIQLEADRLQDAGARSALAALSSRAEALALLYSLLDIDTASAGVELADYLGTIARSLAQAHGADAKQISVELRMDSLVVSSSLAAPLGLALNELLIDALKYAFPDGRPGRISIGLSVSGDECVLVVADNGVGLPKDFDMASSTGFGLGLVGLLARQAGGTLAASSAAGARFEIRFPRPSPR